ncbi:MAG: glycosyltransferase [Candidatus Omnitrophica bacterium]|nr:glycosyltransferase [Candidatus Omnitrophota bacterium]
MKKVLIFYISKHSGHYHAASAIEKGLCESADDIKIEKINCLNYTNPILGKIINRAYMEVIKKKPEIWEHIYDNPNFLKKTKKAREALHKFNMSKIKKLLNAHSPDIVFCTQAFPCGMVADYKRTSGKDFPLVGVLTDYAPHSYWLFDEVDYYIVPARETGSVLEEKGIPRDRIKPLGIPVDPKFREKHVTSKIRRSLGLDVDASTILIMGGTQGLGAMEEAVKSLLLDKKHKYQILVVAGANKKLYKRLNKLNIKTGSENIRVFSYIDNVDELMDASDVIISKAGGMTTAESLAKGLPMLIVDPIPGHERMNTDFLVEKKAAVENKDFSKIHDDINKLFDTEDILSRMRENIKFLAKPNSALDVAKLVLER